MQRLLATGSAAPARYGGHRRRVLGRYEADLRRLVEAMPDLTLTELRTDLERRSGAAGLDDPQCPLPDRPPWVVPNRVSPCAMALIVAAAGPSG